MKKTLVLLGILALMTQMLTACGGDDTDAAGGSDGSESAEASSSDSESDSESAGSTEALEFWVPPFSDGTGETDEEVWAEIVGGFKDESGVDVNVTVIPWGNFEEKYLTGVSGGQGPDVGYMYTEMMGDYLLQDAIVPMDDYLGDTSDYLYLEAGSVDGAQIAVPFVVGGARVVYYNQDLLDEAGAEVPSTWEDFQAASEKLLAAGITPTAQAWGDPARGMLNQTFFPALWQAGGDLFTPDGTKTAFNSPEGVEAATFLLELKESGAMPDSVTSLNSDETLAQFTAGKIAFYFGSDASSVQIGEAGFNSGFIDSLEGPAGKGTFVATDSLVLLDKCADKQLCTDFIQYITAAPQAERFHQMATFPPLNKSEAYIADEAFQAVYAQPEMLHGLPIVAGGAGVYNVLYENLQQMMLGQKTPEQALQDAADAGDSSLAVAQGQ